MRKAEKVRLITKHMIDHNIFKEETLLNLSKAQVELEKAKILVKVEI